MPSLSMFKRHAYEPGWFVVCDPAGRYRIAANGTVFSSSEVSKKTAVILATVLALAGAILFASFADSIRTAAPLVSLGVLCGLILALFASTGIGGLDALYRDRQDRIGGVKRSVRIDDERSQAWRLCETALKIARTASWADQTVDRDRRVSSIAWSAVGRSIVIEKRRADAQRALMHAALEELARDTLSKVEREQESLTSIESNLQAVLKSAETIDRKRIQIEYEKQLARERKHEERELRGRLAGGYADASDPFVSDAQADMSAGLASESEVVATLLADSDRMLQGIDS